MNDKKMAKLKGMVASLEKSAGTAKNEADAKRMQALADVLKQISPAA